MDRLLAMSHNASMASLIDRCENPMAAIEKLGAWLSQSLLFGCNSVAQGIVIVLSCRELGISLTDFARTYDIVQGKLRKKAIAAHAEFLKLGGKVKWRSLGSKTEPATAEMSFDGQSLTVSFGVEDARQAGLFRKDSAWEKWPSELCCARVLSKGISRLAPQIYAGCEDASESAVSELVGMPELNIDRPAEASSTVATPVSDTQAEAKTGLAPFVLPEPTPKLPTLSCPTCNEEDFAKLLELVKGREQETARFLRQFPTKETAWLKEGESLAMISYGNLKLLLKAKTSFLERLNQFIEKEAGR